MDIWTTALYPRIKWFILGQISPVFIAKVSKWMSSSSTPFHSVKQAGLARSSEKKKKNQSNGTIKILSTLPGGFLGSTTNTYCHFRDLVDVGEWWQHDLRDAKFVRRGNRQTRKRRRILKLGEQIEWWCYLKSD